MALRRSAEGKAARAEAKATKQQEAERERQRREAQKALEAYYRTPPGQARLAFDRGDHVFQYSLDVMSQQAIIVAMVGSTTSQRSMDPTAVLNAVCHEGWELVNGSFVFVEQGQQSRDKFMSSGQNVAIKGTTVGYYLFTRCEANRRVANQRATTQSKWPTRVGADENGG
jgi:hypothetical protein